MEPAPTHPPARAMPAAMQRMMRLGLEEITAVSRAACDAPPSVDGDAEASIGKLLTALERIHVVAYSLSRLLPPGDEPDAPSAGASVSRSASRQRDDGSAEAVADGEPRSASSALKPVRNAGLTAAARRGVVAGAGAALAAEDTGLGLGLTRRDLLFGSSGVGGGDDIASLSALGAVSPTAGESLSSTASSPGNMHALLDTWTSRIQSTADTIRRLQLRMQEAPSP